MNTYGPTPNARPDGLPGSEEERSRDGFVNLGGNVWARRVQAVPGAASAVTASLEEEMVIWLRAIAFGIAELTNRSLEDLVEDSTSED